MSWILLAIVFCFGAASVNSQENTASGCSRWYEVPHSDLEIDCPSGHVVSVTKAFYGYWKNSNHGFCSYSDDDCTEDAMHLASDACRGQTNCKIPIATPLIAHVLSTALDSHRECAQWNDRHDYLQVYYNCEPMPDNFVYQASTCTHMYTFNEEAPHPILKDVLSPLRNTMQITCPANKVIRIVEGAYGWWKHNIDRGCRYHEEDCLQATAVSGCDGKSVCDIDVRRSVVSAHCGQQVFGLDKIDRSDYFQVTYKCVTER